MTSGPADLEKTIIGSMFAANAVNWFLTGILVRQMVTGVSILETAHWITLTVYSWHYAVENLEIRDQVEASLGIHWSAGVLVILTGIVSLMVESFYISQIWMLAKDRLIFPLTVLIGMVSLIQSITAVTAGSLFLKGAAKVEGQIIAMQPLFQIWLDGSFVANTLIVLSLSWVLYRAKRRAIQFQNTVILLNQVIWNVIKTRSLTSISLAVAVALFAIFPNPVYYIAAVGSLQKLYAIGLLASLNGRRRQITMEVQGSSIHFA
ncbi:hypothetical protein D9758_010985 [Tetrapyrgos nigripes]|uniref:DUF6534 domain-containing protein n=1 Tax=Tetrapyrgos nigripes TaxID=182062 RepID=A0A8H5LPW3_9AGAR|nr:hypothetical protein D9758_010985 [Tetrapyrgos nigripes]